MKKTMRYRVLELLEAHKDEGINGFAFYKRAMPTFAQRISELRLKEGYDITSIPEKTGSGAVTRRYFLKG